MTEIVCSVDKYLLELVYPKDCELCGCNISCSEEESPKFEGMCLVCHLDDDIEELED